MKTNEFEPYTGQQYSEQEILERSENFLKWADTRRSVRDFSSKPVPQQVMENIIMTASTAPSGAHKQPWTFCLISNKELKSELRKLAEEEEFKSYNGRMSEEWLKDLAPLGTNWEKEFIDVAPWIVVLMKRIYENDANGEKQNNYYVAESVGIAAGFFLMAVHNAGLVALTHTPSPMNFITKALGRPENERPFLLIPVGFPAEKAQIPCLKRKDSSEVIELYK
ncbi:MAG: nitroreductase family protein [Crocinitomicaceae bacterium]|jgi:iodotyrosine deiodinase|nr:nitroreductase family protein [Crocinitomicaceae bacterium]MDP5010749.1 nitroreductase family protein [Crocinitomicaceae bacterium]